MGKRVEWSGGECPVPTGTLVDIQVRGGEIAFRVPANQINPGWPDASPTFWYHDDDAGDIVRYRICDLQPAEPDTPVKTLRDEFAMAIIGGLYAAQIHGLNGSHWQQFAEIAYQQADAMLAARKESE